MKQLETERLILRSWTIEDKYDLYDYAKNDSVGPDAGWKPHDSVEKSEMIIKSFICSDDVYAIVLKENMKVIGSIGVHKRAPIVNCDIYREIGAVLNPIHWGKGLVPEGIRRVLEHCFNELNVDEVWCGHFESNLKSRRVIQKCNFKYQFKEVQTLGRLDNKIVTSLYYKMNREDYMDNLEAQSVNTSSEQVPECLS